MDFPRAYQTALRRLSVREYSVAEMRRYLTERGVDEVIAGAVVGALGRERLIDDDRYAQSLIRRLAMGKKGSEFIRARLLANGVDWSLARVRETYRDGVAQDELGLARKWVKSRYPRAAGDASERRRALAALLRRGFSAEVARAALPPAAPGSATEPFDADLDL